MHHNCSRRFIYSSF